MEIPAEFYDQEYFTAGTKSNYAPYGPGDWASALAAMVARLRPTSVLDVGCATGLIVKQLRDRKIPAWGFDISEWAIANAVTPEVYVGRAEDEKSYKSVDLITAFELPEHLTPDQARKMFVNANNHALRMLCLIAAVRDGEEMPDLSHEKDKSHINIQPISWWRELADRTNWVVLPTDRFDNDPTAKRMGWSGRFLYLGDPDAG